MQKENFFQKVLTRKMGGSLNEIAPGPKVSKVDGPRSRRVSVCIYWDGNSDKMEGKAKLFKENVSNMKEITKDDRLRSKIPLENVIKIQVCPDVIVKIAFKYVSSNITDTPPEGLKEKRGKKKSFLGSGRITNLRNVTNLGITCNSRTCKKSASPKKIYAEVWIKTVSKLFDKYKGWIVTCEAFCYNKNSHRSTEKMDFYDITESFKDSWGSALSTRDTKPYHKLQVILNEYVSFNKSSDNQKVDKQICRVSRESLLNIENYIDKHLYLVKENLVEQESAEYTDYKEMFLILRFSEVAACIRQQEPASELDTSTTYAEAEISSETEEKKSMIYIANLKIFTEIIDKSISYYDTSQEKEIAPIQDEINKRIMEDIHIKKLFELREENHTKLKPEELNKLVLIVSKLIVEKLAQFKQGELIQVLQKLRSLLEELNKYIMEQSSTLKQDKLHKLLKEELNNCVQNFIELVEKELTTREQVKAMKSSQGKHNIYFKRLDDDPEKEFKNAKEEHTFQIHQKCIDILSFTFKDLPECYQHKAMEDLILSLANLTVRIEISEKKQTDALLGTGKVDDVFIYSNNQEATCRCNKCKDSEHPSKDWGEVRIVTSAQLVKGDSETQRTTCTLFYDSETSLQSRRFIHWDRIVVLNIDTDLCKFMCITCDLELLNELDKMVDTFVDSWEKAFDKYVELEDCENEKLAVIVSHPFGLRKHVSIGKWTEKMIEAQKVKRFRYDAPTYPGSRGAFVLMPSFKDFDDLTHFKC